MKIAVTIDEDGNEQFVDASGKPIDNTDIDRPMLHIFPELFVPDEVAYYAKGHHKLKSKEITLSVASSLGFDVTPQTGILIRQPFPNRRYYVAGSKETHMGWMVPINSSVKEFDIIFKWSIESAFLCSLYDIATWQIDHKIHITLREGTGITYSMNAVLWTKRDTAPINIMPYSVLMQDKDNDAFTHRQIIAIRESMTHAENNILRMHHIEIEEAIMIDGVPYEHVQCINYSNDSQFHDIEQASVITKGTDDHYANAAVKMPTKILYKAIQLAREIPFDQDSSFIKSMKGTPGACEHHPSMEVLSKWWEDNRSESERTNDKSMRTAMGMPFVRITDDGEYWAGYYETPNEKVKGFNPSKNNAASVGDLILVMFMASMEHAKFDGGTWLYYPDGTLYIDTSQTRDDYLNGKSDEAWYCLIALVEFPHRFPEAWEWLQKEANKN